MQDRLDQLRAIAMRHPNRTLPVEGLRAGIHVGLELTQPVPSVYEPMVCIVLQGAKRVMIGEQQLRYDPASYLIATLDLPASGCIIEASADAPYIAASMALNRDILAELLCAMPEAPEEGTRGFAVSPMTDDLLDPWLRLLGLFDRPQDIGVLAPLAEREILYRLLQGPQGGMVRQAARADSGWRRSAPRSAGSGPISTSRCGSMRWPTWRA